MTLPEQLSYMRANLPEAYKYFTELLEYKYQEGYEAAIHVSLPKFDDNDELIREDD